MTANDTTKRDAALWLLKRGLVNPSQAARLAGVSRQLVMHWLNVEAIDWRTPMDARLKALWKRRLSRGS
jgi:hypothetical protein